MDSAFPSGGKDAGSIPTGSAFYYDSHIQPDIHLAAPIKGISSAIHCNQRISNRPSILYGLSISDVISTVLSSWMVNIENLPGASSKEG